MGAVEDSMEVAPMEVAEASMQRVKASIYYFLHRKKTAMRNTVLLWASFSR